jgi:hypothetical protein
VLKVTDHESNIFENVDMQELYITIGLTLLLPATISMALGKMAAVFALRTSVTSCKGIVFWIKEQCQHFWNCN